MEFKDNNSQATSEEVTSQQPQKIANLFNGRTSQSNLDYASELFRALSNKRRIGIINFIREKGVTDVAPIYNALKLEQSVVSHDLAILNLGDLLNSEKKGKHVFVSIKEEVLDRAYTALKKNGLIQ